MRFPLILFAFALAIGCQQPDVSELEAETKELRAEIRELREELRALRKEARDLREKVELSAATKVAEANPITSGPGDAGPLPTLTQDGKLPPQAGPLPKQRNVKISIASNPRGATVFLQDRILGRTPLLYEPPPSSNQLLLRIEKPGYRPRLLSIRPDEDAKISVQLARQ